MPEINKSEFEILKGLLKDNLKSSAEVLETVSSVQRYIRWQKIWSICRVFLIVIPIILGFIYLPPLLKEVVKSYSSLLN